MRLEHKKAIITGGARGIGRATAELFVKEGAEVIIWDVLEAGEEVAADIRATGGKAHFVKVDTTNPTAVESATKEAHGHMGRIDILVNNAGITRDRTLLKMSHVEWEQVINVNLSGVFNCTKAVAPIMKGQNYGRIISASSIVGLYGNFGQTNYVATKAGVIGMTKVWAKELGKYGITANCIAPGFTLTEMTEKIPPEVREKSISLIPVKRIGMPIDIAYGYVYLASDEASFVNGICLSIDGGASK